MLMTPGDCNDEPNVFLASYHDIATLEISSIIKTKLIVQSAQHDS